MLERFVTAQDPIYAGALAELRAGNKRTHWMWFIFPQLRGLGQSERAVRYGIADLAEARAYLAHTVLGPRLRECTHAVLAVAGKTAHGIFGSPDDRKFHSSMTLFFLAATDLAPFRAALERYFGGELDPITVQLLGRG